VQDKRNSRESQRLESPENSKTQNKKHTKYEPLTPDPAYWQSCAHPSSPTPCASSACPRDTARLASRASRCRARCVGRRLGRRSFGRLWRLPTSSLGSMEYGGRGTECLESNSMFFGDRWRKRSLRLFENWESRKVSSPESFGV
jgi:hypothetical protein